MCVHEVEITSDLIVAEKLLRGNFTCQKVSKSFKVTFIVLKFINLVIF